MPCSLDRRAAWAGRVSLRGSLDQNVGERFRISSNLQLARTNTTAVPTDGGSEANAGARGAAAADRNGA